MVDNISSVQFSLSVMSNSLQHHGLQHARLTCPSPIAGACSNSCPSSGWCHPTILSLSCLQSFAASGSFPMSHFLISGGQSIGVSGSTSVLPMNIQDWFPFGLTGLISLQSRGLSRVFSNIIVLKHQFFGTQLSLQSSSHIHTWLTEKSYVWLDGLLLTKEYLFSLMCCLDWSQLFFQRASVLISWLQSPPAVILEPLQN